MSKNELAWACKSVHGLARAGLSWQKLVIPKNPTESKRFQKIPIDSKRFKEITAFNSSKS